MRDMPAFSMAPEHFGHGRFAIGSRVNAPKKVLLGRQAQGGGPLAFCLACAIVSSNGNANPIILRRQSTHWEAAPTPVPARELS